MKIFVNSNSASKMSLGKNGCFNKCLGEYLISWEKNQNWIHFSFYGPSVSPKWFIYPINIGRLEMHPLILRVGNTPMFQKSSCYWVR